MFMMMMTFIEVKDHQMSNMVNYELWLPNFSVMMMMMMMMMMMTFMEIKGHQRLNVVNYELWLPNLVRRIPDASS